MLRYMSEMTMFHFVSCGIALYVGGVVKDPAGLFYSNPEELHSLGATVKWNMMSLM